jgi:branched-chain amino acid aminotransferase
LFSSASKMRLPLDKTKEDLRQLFDELMTKNKIPDSGIRITLTGGYSSDGYSLTTPNLVISQKPLLIDDNEIPRGIQLVSYEHQRQIPDVKTIDYIMAIWLKPYVVQQQADDLLYHHGGIISESPRSNFFIVTKDEKIITPARNILKGINRKYVIQIAQEQFDFEERDITLDEVFKAEEAFLTSTTKLVLPVLALDGRKIGGGEPGEITLRIKDKLKSEIFETV